MDYGLPRAEPKEVGMSATRLNRIAPIMRRWVDDGKIPCVLTMIARAGKLVHFEKIGMQDVATEKPIDFDTIFRIYSMTKPITSVAIMMLYEEGHFQLNSPVSAFIPAFKDMKVYANHGDAIVDTEREMTIKHLLTHTSGLIYGGDWVHPINDRYRDANFFKGDLEDMVNELADIPLLHHPGDAWNYGMSTDVLGYLVEVVSGIPFAEFLRKRIFEPLEMVDTDFSVPEDKADRYASVYEPTEDGGIQEIANPPVSSGPLSFFHAGGAGLQSTAADYLRFCQMMLNKGEYNGERLLGRKTVEMMTMNHISEDWQPLWRTGCGFGLGFAVVTDVAESNTLGSLGTFSWGGLASTTFWIDPVEELVAILMTQLIGENPFHAQFRVLTYQAIVD